MEQNATYLVETWRDQPTLEVLEDDFNTEYEALTYAQQVANLSGVMGTKVFALLEDGTLIKIAEFE